jgi:hypothetical protein
VLRSAIGVELKRDKILHFCKYCSIIGLFIFRVAMPVDFPGFLQFLGLAVPGYLLSTSSRIGRS